MCQPSDKSEMASKNRDTRRDAEGRSNDVKNKLNLAAGTPGHTKACAAEWAARNWSASTLQFGMPI